MRRTVLLASVLLASLAVPPAPAGALNLFGSGGAVAQPLKASIAQVTGAPIVIDSVSATHDGQGNLTVQATYHNVERRAITAVRIRFEVDDPFGGNIGYFNGVSQQTLGALKTVTNTWPSDHPYPIAGSIRAQITDVAFADGSLWQAPNVPNPVIAAEHQRLLQIYDQSGLTALLKALEQ